MLYAKMQLTSKYLGPMSAINSPIKAVNNFCGEAIALGGILTGLHDTVDIRENCFWLLGDTVFHSDSDALKAQAVHGGIRKMGIVGIIFLDILM